MKAIVWRGTHDVRFDTVPDPEIQSGDIDPSLRRLRPRTPLTGHYMSPFEGLDGEADQPGAGRDPEGAPERQPADRANEQSAT